MRAMKVLRGQVVGFATKQECSDLLQGRKWIARRNHAHIEDAIIDIGIGGHFYDVGVFARIAYDYLYRFAFPQNGTIPSLACRTYFYGERMLFGELFGR